MQINYSISKTSSLWTTVFLLTMLVYAAGLFIDIMEPDAAVYAEVSMEMHDSGDFFSIYHKHADWLDKPPFPFWMSAASYSIFGVGNVGYKFPAIIFVLIGAWYTFLFARRYYSPLHGWIASLLLLTTQHIIISNQDVRAEPFMTGLVIMGLYHFAVFADLRRRPQAKGFHAKTQSLAETQGSIAEDAKDPQTTQKLAETQRSIAKDAKDPQRTQSLAKTQRSIAKDAKDPQRTQSLAEAQGSGSIWMHAVAGSLALACLMMTKGLFTIIPVAAGIGLTLIYRRQWSALFDWRWLVCGLLILLFLTPALYGYYQQFDLHPEKEIFGIHGVSGVEFFLWTSQWGRFTNTGPIKGSGDPFFFVHTLLWAYLPWSFAAFYGMFIKTRKIIRRRETGELFTFFGFIALFLIFSASKFQLSFYLNPLFPLLAIITTSALLDSRVTTLKIFSVIHAVVCVLILLALTALHYFFLATWPHADTILIILICVLLSYYLFSRKGIYLKKIVFATALIFLSVNYYVNRDFYPALLKYQAASEAAHFVKENNIPVSQLVYVGEVKSAGDIILHHVIPIIPTDSISATNLANKFVFAAPDIRHRLDSMGMRYEVVASFPDFPVTRLTGTFINRKTRERELKQRLLLRTGRAAQALPVIDISQLDRSGNLLRPQPFGQATAYP